MIIVQKQILNTNNKLFHIVSYSIMWIKHIFFEFLEIFYDVFLNSNSLWLWYFFRNHINKQIPDSAKLIFYIYHFSLFAFDLYNKRTTQVVIVDEGNSSVIARLSK